MWFWIVLCLAAWFAVGLMVSLAICRATHLAGQQDGLGVRAARESRLAAAASPDSARVIA